MAGAAASQATAPTGCGCVTSWVAALVGEFQLWSGGTPYEPRLVCTTTQFGVSQSAG